ncbi:ComF family protein [Microbacterium sp. KKR3/1]|uniref:ComF family protein n=1 Tax=Microbacterium sp. KKR3/1 TaxID=2904241 RepID=UPI001E58D533|nr:phosphoribosyltransferase family protein [Microbacterium sp. KKR3/1]MCE0508259.1 ComF family protein [Microbacterium sp. KKR3/1]
MQEESRLLRIGAELAAFLLAANCAGCGEPGLLLCPGCRSALAPRAQESVTPAGLPVWSALEFDGVAARCIRRLKGEGDTLIARPLGAALASVLTPLVTSATWIVPVPTSRAAFRRRGYRVPDLLVRRAHADPQAVLAVEGARPDQRGLGARARQTNVRGAMRARHRGEGAEAVIVDDVITTGATFDEAARALTVAGFRVVAAVALAATPLRGGFA